MKYEKMIQEVIAGVGGAENITSVYHCVTRLRFHLKDEGKANDDAIKNIEGVLSVIKAGGQYQVVVGQKVGEVYKELISFLGLEEQDSNLIDASEMKAGMKEKKVKSSLFDLISGIFTPILGIMVGSGVIKGVLALLTATGILASTSGTYQILYMIGDGFFTFMPILLGYTAMKKFGGTPFIGLAIGCALVYPSITTILAGEPLYTLFSGTILESPVYITFLGIPVILKSYTSTVFPVVVICYLASKLEKFFNKRINDMFKMFAVPALTLTFSLVAGFLVIGPFVSIVSDLLGAAISALYSVSAVACGFLYGSLIQLCVVFGVHWGFVAISINNLSTMGYDPVTIAGLSSAFGQAGVVLVILLKTRNQKIKSVCAPAILSAMLGITEPAIYGVTLQNKMSFILASIASGLGGAIIGMGGVKQYFYGTNGIFGWLQVINPNTGFDSSVAASIIACVVSFVVSILLMATIGKNSIPDLKKV
ncbi:PTS transporter subunit EIIC [Konateibacter massiliensis]|uniref:PTS transporter subunit EIIC n=1 Tax=Konateibacter massiliensis TaxID=2002841 RepID=UPI000C15659C|nr:PTS transporter subunit EIIC [Konateibacter massiliensis]